METAPRWIIIRTEPRHELAVYSTMLDLATDAWLPREPRFSQPHARFQRQWWAPVLPGCFFAEMPLSGLYRLSGTLFMRGIARDYQGDPIIVPADMVMLFRDRLNRENAQIMRLSGIRTVRRDKNESRKRMPSRRLKSRVANEIRADVASRLTHACNTLNLVA